jgi:hypothetical protein
MRLNYLFILGLCAILFSQMSCSNEVEVIGIWKDIPVVYGVINHQDSLNYIRIERAYLPPNESALTVAKNIDSLYFDTSKVDIDMLYILNGDTVLWPKPFEWVNLADEGITRDSGMFASEPSYAYKLVGTGSTDLLLRIVNNETGNTFYARTEQLSSAASTSLLFMNPFYSLSPNRPVAWREDNAQGDRVYSSLTVEMSESGFASIYDYKFEFYYDEYQIDGNGAEVAGSRVDKSIIWRAASDFIPSSPNQTKRVVRGEAFYQFLANTLSDVTGTDTRRCAGYLELYVDGGSASLRDYILARQANEGFVGGLYPAEPYSNIEGGYGILATSDRMERQGFLTAPKLMKMSILTYEHIKEGDLTSKLGFESLMPCF